MPNLTEAVALLVPKLCCPVGLGWESMLDGCALSGKPKRPSKPSTPACENNPGQVKPFLNSACPKAWGKNTVPANFIASEGVTSMP